MTSKHLKTCLVIWNVEVESFKEIRPERVFWIKSQDQQELIFKNLGPSETRILGLSKLESEERLALEHDVLRYLNNKNVPVPVPLQTKYQNTYLEQQGNLYTLSPCLRQEGARHSGDWPVVGPVFGKAIAKLHKGLATYPNPNGFLKGPWNNDPIATYDIRVSELLSALPKNDLSDVKAALKTIETGYFDTLTNLPQQLIHRDCHVSNILADKNEIVGFTDFDHLSIGAVTFDLAYFFLHQIEEGIDDPKAYKSWHDLMAYVMKGYHDERPLRLKEQHAIPYLMIFNQFIFLHGKIIQNKLVKARIELRKLLHICENLAEITSRFTQAPG